MWPHGTTTAEKRSHYYTYKEMIKLINELQLTENDHSTPPTGTFNRVKMILRQQELEPE